MRRVSTLAAALLAATGTLVLAGVASAQTAPGPTAPGEARGLRYLSWQGRGETADPADRAAAPAPVRRDLRRPNPVIPHGGFAAAEPAAPGLTPAPGPVRRTLTPANAWLRPAPAPVPSGPAPSQPPPAPVARSAPPPPPPGQGPEYLPDQGGRGQPAPAEIIQPAPARLEDAAPADPMAPRRDAPIFRMQAAEPVAPPAARDEPAAPARPQARQPHPPRVAEVVNTGERPPQQGARYYSVHRQNGRDPDALTMPAPTYVDALAVTMTETPVTQDLAQPDQGPTLIRDRNGNMRAAPAPSDGDHQ